MDKPIMWGQLTTFAKRALPLSTSKDHLVGAAVLDEQGRIFTGANHPVDNHRSSIHAEDSAVASMLNAGGRQVRALVVVAADYTEDGTLGAAYFTYPCGSCRSLIADYTAYGEKEEARLLWDGRVQTISWAYPCGTEQVPA
jgi:cytidine deaminase